MTQPSQSKIVELYKQFKQAFTADQETGSRRQFDALTRKVLFECIRVLKREFAAYVPPLRIRLCNKKEFDRLLENLRVTGERPTAFIEPLRGFIAVDIESLSKDNLESFILNLVMNLIEELVHASFPAVSELEVKKITYEATESYLGIPVFDEYKRKSLESAKGSV